MGKILQRELKDWQDEQYSYILIREAIYAEARERWHEYWLRRDYEATRERIAWLESHDRNEDEYADIFREVYGYRPQW